MQLQKVASIEIVQKNIAELRDKLAAAQLNDTKRTGPERYKPGEEARDLTTKLNNAMKEQDRLMKDAGIERGDAAKRLKSGLDAKATRLKNKRDSLIKALEEHKKIAKAEPSDLLKRTRGRRHSLLKDRLN